MATSFGIDPSLRHGSVVKVAGSGELEFEEVFSWNKKSKVSIGQTAKMTQIRQLSGAITQAIADTASGKEYVIVEFDRNSVYWRSGKLQIVTLALFIGFLTAELSQLGFRVSLFKPKEIREFYGFGKGDKEAFQHHFSTYFRSYLQPSSYDLLLECAGSDKFDATMIAMIYHIGGALWARKKG